jgi:alkylation response protein AidB-like acyl-CoA dehydrogenase
MSIMKMSDEARMTLDVVRKFARNEIEPIAEEIDVKGEFPRHLYKKMGELGLLGQRVPEEYGGSMGDKPDIMMGSMCNEELAKVSAGFVLSVGASTALFGNNVMAHGNEDQKRKYVPPIVKGDAIGCWGLTEPEAGSDALGIKTKAVRDGDHWVINGQKTFITNAPIADYFIVLTRTSGNPGDIVGGTAFILERGMEGLSTGKPFEKMGMRCSPTGEIFLDSVRVPDSQMLGKVDNGFFDMMGSLDFERAVAGTINVGIAQACLDICVKYVKDRKQFGKPLAKYQMIQEKIATMYRDIEIARNYIYHVLEMIEAGKRVTAEAGVAKWFATEIGTKSALEAIQILGGYGYCREYKVERYMRDAKLLEIGAGTNEINKLLIARMILGK